MKHFTTDITTAFSDLKDFTTAFTTAFTGVKDFSTGITTAFTDLKDFRTDVTTAFTDLKDFTTDITTVFTDVKDFSTHITTVFTDVKDFSTDFKPARVGVTEAVADFKPGIADWKGISAVWREGRGAWRDGGARGRGDRRRVGRLRWRSSIQAGGNENRRKHVATLMRKMGIEALYRKPNLSRKNARHKIYPYLLRRLQIDRTNQVWAMDITYIPMAKGFVYLAAVLDWHSRRVLSWRVSITMHTDFCIEAVEEAIARYGKPEIFNTDQGSQFTSEEFIGLLKDNGIAISMDGKGCWRDNVFVERLWKSVKYEEVYLHAYDSVSHARNALKRYFRVLQRKAAAQLA